MRCFPVTAFNSVARTVHSYLSWASHFQLSSTTQANLTKYPHTQKPTSGKARKVQLQSHRATKAARTLPVPFPDEILPTSSHLAPSTHSTFTKSASYARAPEDIARDTRKEQSMKLESRFLRLPQALLDYHRTVAATEVLVRPVDEAMGVLRVEELQPKELEGLTCPKRPKWSYTLSKKEVEKNEGSSCFWYPA